MKKPAFAFTVMGLVFPAVLPAQEEGEIDIEARKRSIVTLEKHIAEREARMAELAEDILRLDKRTETQLQRIVDKLASVSDSQTSKWRISQTKMDAMRGLGRTVEDYQQKRNELVQKMREDQTGIPKNVIGEDVAKFDDRIEKRVEQILQISRSFTQEKDVEKYENIRVGDYYTPGLGWSNEVTRISEEYRQNRRDRTMDSKNRKEVMEALEKAIRRLEQMVAAQEDSLKNRNLTAADREILESELANNQRILQARRNQLGDMLEVGTPGTAPLQQSQAHDFEMAIRDAASDLRHDYETIFLKYAELNRQRSQAYRLQSNLEARKKWIADYEAKNK